MPRSARARVSSTRHANGTDGRLYPTDGRLHPDAPFRAIGDSPGIEQFLVGRQDPMGGHGRAARGGQDTSAEECGRSWSYLALRGRIRDDLGQHGQDRGRVGKRTGAMGRRCGSSLQGCSSRVPDRRPGKFSGCRPSRSHPNLAESGPALAELGPTPVDCQFRAMSAQYWDNVGVNR